MSVSVANLTALKGLSSDSKKLRFVESKKTWYWCDPASSDTADDENVVLPNSSLGRWYKIRSSNETSDVINWQEQASSNFTASTGTGYILNLSSGDVEVTLPSNPSVGQIVGLVKVNPTDYGNNRIIVKRNGNDINGEAFDRQIVHQNQQVIFRYIGSAGWLISSTTHPVFYFGGAIYTFTKPAELTDPQRGILDFCGKGFDTNGTWSNPIQSAEVRISRYRDVSNSHIKFLADQVLTGTTTSTATTFSHEGASDANMAAFLTGFMHIGFRGASGRISQVKLTDIYWHNYTGSNTTYYYYIPNWMTIYGTNDPNILTVLNYGSTQIDSVDKRYNLVHQLLSLDLKLVASVNLSNKNDWIPSPTDTTKYKHRYISFTNSEYFIDYILISEKGNVANGVGYPAGHPPYQHVNEIELYGDIQTIYVP